MPSFFKDLFRSGSSGQKQAGAADERVPRRSSGLAELTKRMSSEGGCCVLDLGPTSPANITYFTGLGHRTYNEDVIRASFMPEYLVANSEGVKAPDPDKFLAENLQFEPEQFDAVLCWDSADYLPEVLVKPVVQRIHRVLRPGGVLMALFHTKDAGPDAPYYRYHIANPDTLEMQRAGGKNEPLRLQRVFNNRHIENLFRDYGSIKFFLGRDNLREVLVVK